MEDFDYKNDVIQSRTGNVGSSDSKMIQQIAELGQVPKSAVKRMAIIKGLCENPDITTPAMRFGDRMENQIFANLKATDERWQSNPSIVSKKYSRPNCGCLTHVDYLLQDDENKVLTVGEAKATRLNFAQARDEYFYQLCHHYLLAKEYAKELGDYNVKVVLCVYDTNDIDYDNHEFDTSRLTVKTLRNMERLSKSYRLAEGMDIIDSYLETMTEYYEEEVVDANLLPTNVQTQFNEVAQFLREIKEKETKIEAFKTKLYGFLTERGISKVKCDDFAFTVVAPTQQVTFDSKKYLADMESSHPRVAKKIREQYKKVSNKKGYVKIMVSKENNND